MKGVPAGADAVDCGLSSWDASSIAEPLIGQVTVVVVKDDPADVELVDDGESLFVSCKFMKLFLCFRCLRQLNNSSICGSYGGG